MDNLCHTLVGAAIGEAGLKRRTRYGNVTLMAASNLPDLDVLVFLTETSGFAFRRGWTHGALAQLVLPLAFTGVVWGIDRLRRPSRTGPAFSAPWTLALAYIGVYSHVFLDYLNNYGIRLLAPFDWRWFYGDAVFIIDPWLWLALGAGVWLARRRRRPVFAQAAVVFAACYTVLMLGSARAAREIVTDVWRETRGVTPRAVMVGPVPVTPFTREVIVDAGDRYETGTFSWWSGTVTFAPDAQPKNATGPPVAAARTQSRAVQEFLVWSRFPFWTLTPLDDGRTRVTVEDMRFLSRGARFSAAATVGNDMDD